MEGIQRLLDESMVSMAENEVAMVHRDTSDVTRKVQESSFM